MNIALQGTEWVQGSRKCLQKALIDPVLEDGATCASLRDAGFDSRPLCYEKNNFCSSIARRQENIVPRPENIDALRDIYNLTQKRDDDTLEARKQVILFKFEAYQTLTTDNFFMY